MPILFPNPAPIIRDALVELLAFRPEPELVGITVSTKLPPSDASRPYVRISSDGGSRTARLLARDAIRVNVWHPDEGIAFDIAALIEGLLTSGVHAPDIRSITPRTRPVITPDPDTGEPLATVGLSAALAPRTS